MPGPKQMKLGVILQGVGIDMGNWRHPDMQTDASVDIDWYIGKARVAEAGKLDLLFITDGLFINKKV
ncbi:LLM class flavin-dependent oxidoreductase, partial [Paenibacillus sepulcri]|nr:LLM class flavin-dependent oxidoreductase [Paenibacillus sepulcri]